MSRNPYQATLDQPECDKRRVSTPIHTEDPSMLNHRRRRPAAISLTVAAVVLTAIPTLIFADSDPVKYPDMEEEWYVVTMQDAKCGYMRSTSNRVGDVIETRVTMFFEIARGDARVSIKSDQLYVESLDGKPKSFSLEMSMGEIPVLYRGVIKKGKVHLTTEQSGVQRTAEYDFDSEIKFAWGQLLEQRTRGLTPGTSFTIKTYEPSLRVDGPVQTTLRVHNKEKVDVLGKSKELTRVTSTVKLGTPPAAAAAGGAASANMEVTTESWVDDEATPVVAVVDMGMLQVRMYRSTREEAMTKGAPPEMFLNTFIHVDRKVPRTAVEVTYRLKLPKDSKNRLPELPATSMQSFKRISDHEGLLTVKRIDWKALEDAAATEKPDAKLKPYLQASTMLDIDDRRIRRLARRGAASATTPAGKAAALRRFVTDYVSDKNLDIGFATASEVAKNRSGDCTEHGVLLAALARAAGIPSRGVSGIVQVPDGPLGAEGLNAFGYHMWTQVYIGGQWVDIDAALRQTDCDPTHIALALMPLGDEGMLESLMAIFPLLGQLEMEIVKIK